MKDCFRPVHTFVLIAVVAREGHPAYLNGGHGGDLRFLTMLYGEVSSRIWLHPNRMSCECGAP